MSTLSCRGFFAQIERMMMPNKKLVTEPIKKTESKNINLKGMFKLTHNWPCSWKHMKFYCILLTPIQFSELFYYIFEVLAPNRQLFFSFLYFYYEYLRFVCIFLWFFNNFSFLCSFSLISAFSVPFFKFPIHFSSFIREKPQEWLISYLNPSFRESDLHGQLLPATDDRPMYNK